MNLIQVLPIGWSGGAAPPELADLCAELASELRVCCEVVDGPFDVSPARHPERLQYHSTELLARMEQLFRQRSPRVASGGGTGASALQATDADNPFPEAGERLPVSGSWSLEAEKGLPEAERQLLVAGSWLSETGNRPPTTDNRSSSTSNQQPTTSNRSSSTSNQQPTTRNQLAETGSPSSETGNRPPSTDNRPAPWRLLGVTSLDLYIPTLTFVFGEAQLHGPCALVSMHRLRQEFYGLPADPRLAAERLLKEAVHELGHTLGLRHCDDYRCAMAPSHAVEWIDLKSPRLCPACQARAASAL